MYAPPPTLNLVVIRSADLERAAKFYSALGLLISRESHGGPEHYSSVVDGRTFEIYPLKPGALATTSVRIGFIVTGLDGVITMALDAGGTLIEEAHESPRWGRRAVIADPDGHRIELTQALEP